MTVRAPGGTVTFLFTDIEGSTRLWEDDATAMAPSLAEHDAIVRRAIETSGGHVFKTVGDAFCSAFSRAEAAAAAALATQRGLAHANFPIGSRLRVRMAIHTGTTVERDADYFGPTVNRVARLLAAGHGGQILLSSVSASLVRDSLEPGVALEDLGEHALKDVRSAERIYALVAPGAPRDFPALRTQRAMPNALPFAASSFVGREDDVANLSNELSCRRAVTLVGTGGIGKTRCAVHVAAAAAERFAHGVRLVELAAVSDPAAVTNAIAAAFEIFLPSEESALDALVRALRWRNVLIVLDNCEHVVGEVARVADRILQWCPDAKIFATSREPLNLRGECVYRLPSLGVPPESASYEIAAAVRYDAVALFVERAKSARAQFALDAANIVAVCAICRRLDGIALAIELAATRLRALGIDELLARLEQRFSLLKGGARTDLPRQQTMRALVDWSYDLLTPAEREAFRRLAVFTNRFDLDAALAICARDERADDADAFDLLESLVDKSLVAVDRDEPTHDRPYRLLETLREYALEKLVHAAESDAIHARLARRCIARARIAEERWQTGGTSDWRRTCAGDLDDVRAALVWALEDRRDIALGVELAAATRRAWSTLAPAEGRRWMLLARDAVDVAVTGAAGAAEVWLGVAQLHVTLGQHAAALEAARRALSGFGDARHEAAVREAETYAGFSLALLGDVAAAKALLIPAHAAFEALGLEHLAAVAATDLAAAHVYAEEFEDARTRFREALGRFRRFDDVGGIEAVTVNLSELEFRSGNVGAAIRLTTDALADRTDDAPILMLANMAAYLCALDRFAEARAYARESLMRAVATGQDVDVVFSIQHLAAIAVLESPRPASGVRATIACAARLLGFVDASLAALSSAREFTEQREYERACDAIVADIGREAFDIALRDGAESNERLAVLEAMALERREDDHAR